MNTHDRYSSAICPAQLNAQTNRRKRNLGDQQITLLDDRLGVDELISFMWQDDVTLVIEHARPQWHVQFSFEIKIP